MFVIISVLLPFVSGDEEVNFTDFSACKLSHLGLEYQGDIGKTESWVRCQSWSSNAPHPIPETITDQAFPLYSRKMSRNYCRNPTRDPNGPWCYTMNTDLKYETCGIPLCSVKICRITGPGMEYSGKHNKGISDRKCLKWNKERSKVKEGAGYVSYKKFEKTRFPEGDLSKAKKYCRNPNGDLGGPWCFVENENTDEIEREYCDIPFCDEPECQVFTRNSVNYTHYTGFNDTLTEFSFGVKLWDSDSYLNASARLALTLLALPVNGKEMADLGVGLEIFISNKGSALTFGNVDSKPEYEDTFGVLKSTEFTMFTLSWAAPFVTLSLEGKIKPIFLAEYKAKKNLLGFKKNVFRFYSALGTNVLWAFPFCKDVCEVHTTTGSQLQQFWPLRIGEGGLADLSYHLRAFHSVSLFFSASPAAEYPNAKLVLQHHGQMSRVTVSDREDSVFTVKEMPLPDLLDYWEFREFSVAFFADTMRFYWTRPAGLYAVFEIRHEVFRSMRWFSPGSETVAHWTFFCSPPTKPPPALPPECALNAEESGYEGTQDVTSVGEPCLPWLRALPAWNKSSASWNYCRDPAGEAKGTYCYVFASDKKFERRYCKLRKCKSEECRMAGTGNDYMGKLSVSRSNRSCDGWFENITNHRLDVAFLNISRFPDASLDDVGNYCRNPSRDAGGTWCYTTDPAVPKDLCDVPDCDRPEENIIIAARAYGRRVYVLPEWKIRGLEFSIKQWDPDYPDAVHFDVTPVEGEDRIRLVVGAEKNRKILLYRNEELKKEKTFPHLVSFGSWTDLWLRMRAGEVALGFKGIPDSFFEYKSEAVFDPMFLTYGSMENRFFGFFFKSDQCQTENVSSNTYTRRVPVNMWKRRSAWHNFTLAMRGRGLVILSLTILPNALNTLLLFIDSAKNEIYLEFEMKILLKNKPNASLINPDNWTAYEISYSEEFFNVTRGNESVLSHRSKKPIIIYYFTLAVEGGWVVWSINCAPLDIDGPPRDGGWSRWSPWQCTVSCGGGEGFRTRTCTNPSPNVMGKLCPGSFKSTGVCNDFPCGDVSPRTLEAMREGLQTRQFSFVVDEGRSVVLENDHDLLKVIREESPDAYFEWTLNGLFVMPEENRKFVKDDDLVVRNAELSDSGVYVCMLYRVNKKRAVLRVVSLAVVSEDYSVKTRATRALVIGCKAVVLAYVYTDLSLKLYLNGEVYKDFGITMLAAVDSEHFDRLNMSHTGDWKCVVEQKDLGLSWVTNYLRVEVKKEPNFYTNLMEDELTKPIFGWLETESNVLCALVFIVVFVILLAVLILVVYFRCCTIRSRWQ